MFHILIIIQVELLICEICSLSSSAKIGSTGTTGAAVDRSVNEPSTKQSHT